MVDLSSGDAFGKRVEGGCGPIVQVRTSSVGPFTMPTFCTRFIPGFAGKGPIFRLEHASATTPNVELL